MSKKVPDISNMVGTQDRRQELRNNASDLLSSYQTSSEVPKAAVVQNPRNINHTAASIVSRRAARRIERAAACDDLPSTASVNESPNRQHGFRSAVSNSAEERVAITPSETEELTYPEPTQQPFHKAPLNSNAAASSIPSNTGRSDQSNTVNHLRLHRPALQTIKPTRKSRMLRELESHNDEPGLERPNTPLFGLDSANGGLHLTRGAKKDLAKLAANLTPSPKKNQNLRKLMLDQFNPRRERKVFINDGSSFGTPARDNSDEDYDEIAWSLDFEQDRSRNDNGIFSDGGSEDESDSDLSLVDTSLELEAQSNEKFHVPELRQNFKPSNEMQVDHGRDGESGTTSSIFMDATIAFKIQQDWTAQKKRIKRLVLSHEYKPNASKAEIRKAKAARKASKTAEYYLSKIGHIPEGYNGSFFHMEGGLFVFKPTAARFTDFGNFIKEVEKLAGRERGVVKVVVPQECIGRASNIKAEDRFLETCKVSLSIEEPKIMGASKLYNMHTLPATRSTPASIWLDAIAKSRIRHIQKWNIDQDHVAEDLKTFQTWEKYTEQKMLKDNEVLDGRRVCATGVEGRPQLRASLECRDPNLKNLMGNRFAASSTIQYGINEPVFNVSGKRGTMFCMQIGPYAGYSMEILHCGAPKCWTVVKPSHHGRLEGVVWDVLHSSDTHEDPLAPKVPRCSQFMRHRPAYVPQETLDKRNIDYTKVVQHQGEMIIIFPWAYHQGYNTGPNISEAMMYATDRWKVFNRQSCYSDCNGHCGEGAAKNFDLAPVVNSLSPVGSRYGRRLDQKVSPISLIGPSSREGVMPNDEIVLKSRASKRGSIGKSKERSQDSDGEWLESEDETYDFEENKRRGSQSSSLRRKVSPHCRNSSRLHGAKNKASLSDANGTRPQKRERSTMNSEAASEGRHAPGRQSKKPRLISPQMRNKQGSFVSSPGRSESEHSLYDIENIGWTS